MTDPQNPYPPQPPYPGPPPTPPKKKRKWPWIVGGVVAHLVIVSALGGGSDKKETQTAATSTAAATVTHTETATATKPAAVTTTSVAPKPLIVPSDLAGMNAQLAYEKLTEMGFTKITPASTDSRSTVPVLLSNWTVVSVEPGPGTSVQSNATLILKVTKGR